MTDSIERSPLAAARELLGTVGMTYKTRGELKGGLILVGDLLREVPEVSKRGQEWDHIVSAIMNTWKLNSRNKYPFQL